MIKVCLQLAHLDNSARHLLRSAKEWWVGLSNANLQNWKAIYTLTMLTSWTICNERNARLFRNKSAPPTILLSNINNDVALWVTTGAKKLGTIMSGEERLCCILVCCNPTKQTLFPS